MNKHELCVFMIGVASMIPAGLYLAWRIECEWRKKYAKLSDDWRKAYDEVLGYEKQVAQRAFNDGFVYGVCKGQAGASLDRAMGNDFVRNN